MAEKATIARPYARAAFEFAHEHDQLSQWSALLGFGAAVAGDPRVAGLLGSPHVTVDELAGLFADAAGPAADERGSTTMRGEALPTATLTVSAGWRFAGGRSV